MVSDNSLSGLPLHGNGVVFSDGELTDLSSDASRSPSMEPSGTRDLTFEVHQRALDTSINEQHLVYCEILDQVVSTLGVEPEISEGLVVDDWRRQGVHYWRVASAVLNPAVVLISTRDSLRLNSVMVDNEL